MLQSFGINGPFFFFHLAHFAILIAIIVLMYKAIAGLYRSDIRGGTALLWLLVILSAPIVGSMLFIHLHMAPDLPRRQHGTDSRAEREA